MDGRTPGLTHGQVVQTFSRRLVVLEAGVEIGAVLLVGEQRQQRIESGLDLADQTQIDRRAAPDLFPTQVHLENFCLLGKELRIGKIRAQHEQGIAVHHGVIAGRKAQQSGHADVIGIVVLDEFLTPQRVDDGRLQLSCQRQQFVVRIFASCAAKNGDLLRSIEQLRRLLQFRGGGANDRRRLVDAQR
jgi:hypothetical protein